jgi:hypothetical protein
MGLGVIRCNDAELPWDLEDSEQRRTNKFRVINERLGFESLSLRQTQENKYLSYNFSPFLRSLSAIPPD